MASAVRCVAIRPLQVARDPRSRLFCGAPRGALLPAMLLALTVGVFTSSTAEQPPGALCHAAGRGHRFYASSWDPTCDCGAQLGPQENGSFCDAGAVPPPACSKRVCNVSLSGPLALRCVNYSNILHQPVLSDGPWTAGYVQPLNVTVPAMLAQTQAMPVGQRLIRLHDVDVELGNAVADRVLLPLEFADCAESGWWCTAGRCEPFPSFQGIWWDAAIAARREGSFVFFAALKAAGGVLDQLVMDSEQGFDGPTSPPPANGTNLTAFWRCQRARWTALQNDPRFPPVQAALLEMGFVANLSSPSWLFDEMSVNSHSWTDWVHGLLDPSPGRGGMNRQIWDAVDVQRHSEYFQIGWGDALSHYFPGAVIANDDLFQHSPRYYKAGFWNSGHVKYVGHGATGIGAQSPQLYFTAGPWECGGDVKDPGCPPHGQSPGIDQAVHHTAGVPYGSFRRTGFNFLRLHAQAVRSMVLANPAAPVRPWLDYKSYGCRAPDSLPAGPSPHYQERLFHLFLTGVDTFYYFNPSTGLVGGTRATLEDHALVSALLEELDDVIGCKNRTWVRDTALGRWRDSFFLTGMALGDDATVWRLSFEHAAGAGNITAASTAVTVSGVLLELKSGEVAPCELRFHQAAVLNLSSIAPAGVWIVQQGGSAATPDERPKVEVVCGSAFTGAWPLQD